MCQKWNSNVAIEPCNILTLVQYVAKFLFVGEEWKGEMSGRLEVGARNCGLRTMLEDVLESVSEGVG